MTIETERLLLREYRQDDFDAIYEILSDAETMSHYPAPFDEERVRGWIRWNLDNYEKYGFGLWAVILKETGELIGDCGLTIQNIDGEQLPEIAPGHVFMSDTLYSYMKYTNVGSYSTALSNGMRKVKEYPDEKNHISYAYAITREEWKKIKDQE